MKIKHKNTILQLGFVLFLILFYHFFIVKTYLLKTEFHRLNEEKKITSNLPDELNKLKSQTIYYDSILGNEKNVLTSSFQSKLLDLVSTFSVKNRLSITAYNEPHLIQKEDSLLSTYSFTVRGDYTAILQLIYKIEQKHQYGLIRSVSFEKKKNYSTEKKYLECTILLQQIDFK